VLNTLRFAIDLSGDEPDLQFRGKPLSHYDAVLPRIGASITYFGTAVVRQFEQMDVYTPNTANGIANARDKLRATQILSRHHIGMPATTFVRDRADVIPAIERVGGAPVVIKLLEGTQGIGVILAPDIKVAEAIIETLQSTKQNVLIQQFVAESRGATSGRSWWATGSWRRCDAALRATSSGPTSTAAADRGHHLPRLEAPRCAAPRSWGCGWPASTCSRATRPARDGGQQLPRPGGHRDRDRARRGRCDRRLHRQPGRVPRDRRPPAADGVDGLRRRRARRARGRRHRRRDDLGVGSGDRDIAVLTLHRGTTVVPNPRGSRVLEAGDRLLCFGKLEEMRSMIPERKRRRARIKKLPEHPLPGV
jgi:ribosomal protein S6--L-glutamate ligase